MATGLNERFTKDSDYVFDTACNPCDKGGRNTEAINYCVECCEYFCSACTDQHGKFGLSAGHNVVNRSLAKQASVGPLPSPDQLPSETCKQHFGERIKTYCADHDLVLCNTCVALDHRLCDRVDYVPKIAGGVKKSKNLNRIKQEISESLKTINDAKRSLRKRLVSADKDKKIQKLHIQNCTERLIKHTRDMKKAAVDEVNDFHRTSTDYIKYGIASLDAKATAMTGRLQCLDNTQKYNDSQVFVQIKRGQQECDEVKQLLNQNVKLSDTEMTVPKFVLETKLDYFLNKMTSMGQFVRKSFTMNLHGEYNVKSPGDAYTCGVEDGCELDDGTILIIDNSNKCIKKLNKSYKITENLQLSSYPHGVCQTGLYEIAVTLPVEKQVQFVNVHVHNTLKLSRSFKVEECCRGICRSGGELFVCCGGHTGDAYYGPEGPGFVGVYHMSGASLRKIQLDQQGQQIFSMPRHITVTNSGGKIHVADEANGIISLDRQGNKVSVFSENLRYAYSVCAVTDGSLLVCANTGQGTNNVLQVDTGGKRIAQLLGEEEGVERPVSVLFLRESSMIMITEMSSNKVKLFEIAGTI